MNLNWIAAILGCSALLVVWVLFRTSGMRGLTFALVGCVVIIGTVLFEQDGGRLLSLAGIVFAIFVLALLVLCFTMISQAVRKRRPHYQPPDEISGACSNCAQPSHLKHYEQGWLCTSCARRLGAKAA